MANNVSTFSGTIYYPIPDLTTTTLTDMLWMELIVDDYGNKEYVNRKTQVSVFFDFLVSSHPIFNKLDDVFNDKTYAELNEETNTISYRYANDIFISGQTYFDVNPYSSDTTIYSRLLDNQTVQKQQLEKFIHDNGLEINSINTNDTCVQYGEHGWIKSESDNNNPRIDTLSFVKFTIPNMNCKISEPPNENRIPYWHSNNLTIFSNAFVTIVGKIKLPDTVITGKTFAYYTPENNLWVGIWMDGNIVAISELHNIDEIKKVAYFSFQFPMGKDQEYHIVVPFDIDETVDPNDSKVDKTYDMFENIPINSACMFYYSPLPDDSQEPKVSFT